MERVKDFKDKLIKGSQNAIFSRIVILVSFLLILARDIIMCVLNGVNSEDTLLPLGYYIFFLTFQFLWSYSSWIMLLLFFYSDNNDLPKYFEFLEDKDGYFPLEIFIEFVTKLWLCGKFKDITHDANTKSQKCLCNFHNLKLNQFICIILIKTSLYDIN